MYYIYSHFLQGHSEIFLHQQLQRVHYEKMHVKKAAHPGKKMPNVIPRPDPNVDNRGFNIQQGQLRRQYAYDPSIEVVPNRAGLYTFIYFSIYFFEIDFLRS